MSASQTATTGLGGWSRLWLVLTVVWAVLVSASAYRAMPSPEDYHVMPANSSVTTEADAMTDTTRLAETPEWSKAPKVEKPSEDPVIDLARYQSAVRDAWVWWLETLLVPPLLIAFAMYASRWIWRGFAR